MSTTCWILITIGYLIILILVLLVIRGGSKGKDKRYGDFKQPSSKSHSTKE